MNPQVDDFPTWISIYTKMSQRPATLNDRRVIQENSCFKLWIMKCHPAPEKDQQLPQPKCSAREIWGLDLGCPSCSSSSFVAYGTQDRFPSQGDVKYPEIAMAPSMSTLSIPKSSRITLWWTNSLLLNMAIYSWFSNKKMVIFHSYFDITRGYHSWGQGALFCRSALLDLAILDSVEAAGILEFSLLWMLGRNPKQGWQLNLGYPGGGLSIGKVLYPLVICYVAIENGHRNSEFSH